MYSVCMDFALLTFAHILMLAVTKLKGFINIFSRRVNGFHRQAKQCELKNLSSRWSN